MEVVFAPKSNRVLIHYVSNLILPGYARICMLIGAQYVINNVVETPQDFLTALVNVPKWSPEAILFFRIGVFAKNHRVLCISPNG